MVPPPRTWLYALLGTNSGTPSNTHSMVPATTIGSISVPDAGARVVLSAEITTPGGSGRGGYPRAEVGVGTPARDRGMGGTRVDSARYSCGCARSRRSRRRLRSAATLGREGLPLGELRRLAGLLQPVLAPFLLPRVAAEHALLLEGGAELRVDADQRARDAVAKRSCLPADTPALDAGDDVEVLLLLNKAERRRDDHAV